MGIPFTEDYPTEGALAIDTPLHHASDFESDAMGRMYVAGDHVSVVFRVDTDDRVYTVAGTQTIGYSGDGGPALEAELGVPFGVLPDDAGGFYICDADAHVVRYVTAGHHLDRRRRHADRRHAVPRLQRQRRTGHRRADQRPRASADRPGQALYFVETKNHVVRRLRADGIIEYLRRHRRAWLRRRRPSGRRGARSTAPYDLRFAPNGDLYIADANNHVIRRIDSNGIITTVVGNGDGTFGGDGGPALQASLLRPSGVNLRQQPARCGSPTLEPPRPPRVALPALSAAQG